MRTAKAAWSLALALALPLLAQSPSARAGGVDADADADADVDALAARAAREDAALAFEAAAADYERVHALDATSARGAGAEARAAELRAHAEGGFAPLARLERVRRDPALSSDAAAVDELVRDTDAFPPGLVRVEAWSLAAEAYAERLGRPAEAAALYRRVAGDPRADAVLARHAAREAFRILAARGDLAGAEDVARAARDLDPAIRADVARLARRHRLHLASIGVLASLLGLAAAAFVAAARERSGGRVLASARRAAPLALAYAAYVGGVGAILASSYETGTARPFLAYGVALGAVLLVARAWAAAGRRSRGARAARAAICGASALASAFLVLEHFEADYLRGLGL